MARIATFCVNMMHENTYVFSDDTKECVIIDCGCFEQEEKEALAAYIDENGLTPKHLLCTHFHLDHVFGNQFILDKYGLQAEVNSGDHLLYELQRLQAVAFELDDSAAHTPKPSMNLDDSKIIKFGNTEIKVISTPGHSPGGVSLYCESEKVVFTGDTLFNGTYGAVNLPGGRLSKLYKSITEKLFLLPEETIVYPGHGAETDIKMEKATNPIRFALMKK